MRQPDSPVLTLGTRHQGEPPGWQLELGQGRGWRQAWEPTWQRGPREWQELPGVCTARANASDRILRRGRRGGMAGAGLGPQEGKDVLKRGEAIEVA